MKYSENIIPISEVKAHTAQMVDHVVRERSPVIITQNGRGKVVVQDLRDYEQTQESMAMLKIIAQGRADIQEGRYKPAAKAFASVRKQVRSKG